MNKAQQAANLFDAKVDTVAAELVERGVPLWSAIQQAEKIVRRRQQRKIVQSDRGDIERFLKGGES